MTLPLITSRSVERPAHKLAIHQLDDVITPSRRTALRNRSSSRDAARRQRLGTLPTAGMTGGGGSNPQLNRENSHPAPASSRAGFHRSSSGNDLRALVTNRNALNTAASKPNKPAATHANLLRTSMKSRSVTSLSLNPNPRTSSGGTVASTGRSPNTARTLYKGVSNPEMQRHARHSQARMRTLARDSPLSTPSPQPNRVAHQQRPDSTGENSRPSSHLSSSVEHAQVRSPVRQVDAHVRHVDAHVYRDMRLVSSTAEERVTEGNISRKEKVIHIVHGAEQTTQNDDVTHQDSTNQNASKQSSPVPHLSGNSQHNQSDTHRHPASTHHSGSVHNGANHHGNHDVTANTHQQSASLVAQKLADATGLMTQKLYENRDRISPPPTPRIGVSAEGEGLSMEVFMRCVDWLEGVNSATHQRSLDTVTLPPITWDD